MFGVGHSRETLGLGTLESFWGWALQGNSGVGHARETLGLGQESLNTPGLGTPGVSGLGLGWALQGVSGVGHSRESPGVDRARRRVPGEEKS